MTSIIDIGVSVPGKRLTDEIYFKATKIHLNGERAVADHDEDSITLAYDAGSSILEHHNAGAINNLFFVSTTPVYGEKLNASLIATALDLKEHTFANDLTGASKSFLSAIRISTVCVQKQGGISLIVSGEKKICAPGSPEEINSGDAGAAVLIGEKNEGIAIVEDYYSSVSNFMDTWRRGDERTTHSGELKYSMEYGFQKVVIKGLKEFFSAKNIKPDNISAMALIAPDGKSQSSVFKATGIKTGREEAEELFKQTGYCGTSAPLLVLVNLLNKLKEGDRVLLCAYGDGLEIILLRITGNSRKIKNNLLTQIEKKVLLTDYSEFLKLKGFIGGEGLKPFTSIPVLTREEDALLRLHGRRCRKCGSIQYPPRRICWNCSAKDEMENIKLNKSGKIYTYTRDYVYTNPFPPTAMAVVDLDGGGRFYCQMVDTDKDKVSIGSKVKLTLRRLHEGGDFIHYFWKAKLEE